MLPDRVAAIIIKDKKILLVTGYDETVYWTPGGKVQNNESHESCLKRELYEELDVVPVSIKPYFSYTYLDSHDEKEQTSHCYFVQFHGQIKPQKEITKVFWYSKQNFIKNNPKVFRGIDAHLLPRMIRDKYL